MAKRGGKGGSSSEFGSAKEAAGGLGPKADGILPSFSDVFGGKTAEKPAAAAAPSEAPRTALQRHYASNPQQRGMRPFKVHSEVDTEGNANQLTEAQVRANKTADEAAAEFDAIQEQIQEQKKANKPAPGAPKARSIFRSTSAPKKPTNRTTGVHVPQEMGIKEFAQKIAGMHSILDAHAKSVQSLTLRPQAQDDVTEAAGHLKDAKFHIGQAETARRGVVVGNKRYSGDAEAGKHYISALGSIRKAHDLLSGEHVSHAANLNNLSVELPTEHLGALEGAANTIPILKKAAPFKSMEFGGIQIDPKTIDLKEAAAIGGKDTEALRKLRAGQQGVAKRQDKFRVLTGKEEKVEGGLSGRGATTRGRRGIVGSIPNPKRRASGQRRIVGRLENADMSRGQTPTFDATPRTAEDIEKPKKEGK